MLADKSRLQIVLALARDGELHVSDLCKLLRGSDGEPASQPAVSHHLTLMRMIGLVDYNRVGKHNYYRLASGRVRALLEQFFADVGDDHRQLQFSDFALSFTPRGGVRAGPAGRAGAAGSSVAAKLCLAGLRRQDVGGHNGAASRAGPPAGWDGDGARPGLTPSPRPPAAR